MIMLRHVILILLVSFPIGASFPTTALARDMQGRLGLGFNRQFSNSQLPNAVPGISLKYGLTRDIAAEAIVGVATTTPGNSVTGIKLFKNLFYETSLNFYYLIGGGILGGASRTSAEIMTGFGAEFFIPGVESLGFSMEFGGTFTNVSGSFALKTFGASPLEAGMHFYF